MTDTERSFGFAQVLDTDENNLGGGYEFTDEALIERDKEYRVVSETGGEKGQKLARYDLIPVDALKQLAERYGHGATKYDERNWERGYNWSLSYAALQRHANQFWNGEEFDPDYPDSHHLAAVLFHAAALLHYTLNKDKFGEFDDRPI
jgi:hypothetical protein